MIESENSKRVLLKATYTPIKSIEKKPGDPKPGDLKIPFHKWNLLTSIKPTNDEIAVVRENLKASSSSHAKTGHEDSSHKDFLKAIKAIEAVIPQFKNPNVLHNVAPFSEISTDALLNVVDEIIKLRQKESDSAIKALNHIFDTYKQQSAQQDNSVRLKQGKTISSSLLQEKQQKIRGQIPMLLPISPSEIKFKTLMDWAIINNIGDGEVTEIMELMRKIRERFL